LAELKAIETAVNLVQFQEAGLQTANAVFHNTEKYGRLNSLVSYRLFAMRAAHRNRPHHPDLVHAVGGAKAPQDKSPSISREKIMKRLTIVLPAIAMLAACNSKPTVHGENASVADVAAATRDAVKLQPGKWETSITILSLEGPGLPPNMAAAMKQRMAGQKVETCLTPEQAARPPQDMLGAAKNCTYETFEMSGGKLSGTLVCRNAPGMPGGEMHATMSGNFASTSYDVTSDTTMSMPAMPGRPAGDVTSKTQVTGKRIGDCDTPKAG